MSKRCRRGHCAQEMLISMRFLKQVHFAHRQFRMLSQVPLDVRLHCCVRSSFGRQKMSLLLRLQKSKNADFTHLHAPDFGLDPSAHRLNLRPCAWLLPTAHEFAPVWHQSFKLQYLHTAVLQIVFHHIAWAYRDFALLSLCQSRPMHQNSRVLAHNERVVGNGYHAASSTRTSLGVLALQGLLSSTLRRISPVAPFSRLAVPLRPWLTSQGINR